MQEEDKKDNGGYEAEGNALVGLIRERFQQAETSKIYDEKAKGGRVGLRRGTPNPFGRKSNTQKIAEVFGPKRKIKKVLSPIK